MYCSCLRPFPVKNSANGEEFTVCVSGKGGCGLEIKTDKSKEKVKGNKSLLFNDNEINEYLDKQGYFCSTCNGSGRSSNVNIYSICSDCAGTGIS